MKISKLVISAFAIVLVFLLSFQSKAQNSTTPFKGACGGVFNVGSIYDALWEYTKNGIDYDEGVSVLISMNFDTSRADLSIQSVNISDGNNGQKGFGLSKAPVEGQNKTRDIEIFSNLAFTVAPLTGVNGAYQVTIKLPKKDETFLMMPVNGGNTFLIQGRSFGAAGVCQKI